MVLLVSSLGCNVFTFPLKYMGLRVGIKFKEIAVWDLIMNRLGGKRVTF